MGVKQSLSAEGEEMRECEWEAAGEKERSFGRSRTLRNRRTGAMVDEYHLSWGSEQEYGFYLKSFNWRHRRRNLAPVVTSVSFRPVCTGQGCSGKYAANVYLEHVALRLSQIEEIPLADSLLILGDALQGYLQLYQHSGYFQVQPQQICFDRAGRVKVWVNSDLSCNHPDTDHASTHKDQVDMVEQLVRIAQEATDPQEMPSPTLEEYFDFVRRREEVQIGFQYAKLVVIQFSRLHQIIASSRFDAVIDIMSNAHSEHHHHKQYNPSTLPSSQTIIFHPQPQTLQRLNTCQSLPNFPPSAYSTMSYQPPSLPHIAVPVRAESSPYLGEQLPTIPRLQELNMSQFGAASVQTKRKSRNSKTSKNSKSQMVGQEQTTQNQSLLMRDSHADDRNTMKSMPLHDPTHRDRFANSQFVRYSQCDQEFFSHKDSEHRQYNNHDAFGLIGSPPHRLIQDSASSYLPSSNSSQSQQRRSNKHSRHSQPKHSNHSHSKHSRSKHSNNSKPSRHSSSRRFSALPNDSASWNTPTHNRHYDMEERYERDHEYEREDRYYNSHFNQRQERSYNQREQRQHQYYQRDDRYESGPNWAFRRDRSERVSAMPQMDRRYHLSMEEEWELDPEIEADIRKYLG